MRRWRSFLGIGIGLLLLLFVLLRVDLGDTVEALRFARYWYLIPAALSLFLFLVAKSVRWRYLLGSLGKARGGALFSAVLVGYFGNQVLVANSGEILRALVLGQRERLSKSAILGTIVIEKVMDVLVLSLFLFTLLLLTPLPFWVERVGLVTSLLLASGVIALFLLLYQRRRASALLGSFLSRVFPSGAERIVRSFDAFVEGMKVFQHKGEATLAFLLGFPMWALLVVSFYFVGLAAHIPLPLPAYTLPMVLVALGAFILTPGGMGTLEFFGTSALATFSVDGGQALAFVILVRAVRLLPIVLGYLAFSREGFGLGGWAEGQEG